MRTYIAILSVLICIGIGGCAIPPKSESVAKPRPLPYLTAHEVTDSSGRASEDAYDSPRFMSCDFKHDYQIDPDARSVISFAWPFALMASNSYRKHAFFVIPNWELEEHFRGALNSGYGVGFQSDIYVRKIDGKVAEVAVVFRGTDHSEDWMTNRSLWWPWRGDRVPAQFQHAEWVADYVKGKYANVPVVFVGHSLGGGLAFHAGWTRTNARVFAFNASPRVWATGTPIEEGRYDIAESGEVLRYIQFWRKLPGKQIRMNFRESDPFDEHNIYHFARALLYQATWQEFHSPASIPQQSQSEGTATNASRQNFGCSGSPP